MKEIEAKSVEIDPFYFIQIKMTIDNLFNSSYLSQWIKV